MKKAIGMIALLLTTILILGGCLGGSDTPASPPASPATLPAIQAEISSLRAELDILGQTVTDQSTSIANTATVVDTTPLEIAIASLDAQVIALTSRMALYEKDEGIVIGENGTVEVATTWSPVRWRYDIDMEYNIATVTYEGNLNDTPAYMESELRDNINVEIDDVDPRTIKEEDLYDVELLIFNGNDDWSVDLEDVVFLFTLRPDNYAYLDEDMTYLDSDSSPYLDWEASFVVRERESEDVTRRVEFESNECSIDIDEDSYEGLDLVLELYYG